MTDATLDVTVNGIPNGERIPTQFARCISDGKGRSKNGPNIRPEISWSGGPKGT